MRGRADRDRPARRPALRRRARRQLAASASSRRCARSGRSTGWRCSRPRARASCATAPSARRASTTSSPATRSSLRPGDQIVADGRAARGPRPAGRRVDPDGRVRPGRARRRRRAAVRLVLRRRQRHLRGRAVGADAYANELTGVAREDRRELSPLQLTINRLLRLMVALMIPIASCCCTPCTRTTSPMREAVSTAVAGIVSLVPEGLVLLASLVFAVAAARVGAARRARAAPARGRGARRRSTSSASTRPARSPTARSRSRRSCRSAAPTSPRCTRCWARSPPASAAATRPRTRSHAQLGGAAADRPARGAVLVALEVERDRLRRRHASSCWERPRCSCARTRDPALARRGRERAQERRLRVLLFAARARPRASPRATASRASPRSRRSRSSR